MQSKTSIFPVETLNNINAPFQVSVPFIYGLGVQPISLTSTQPAAGSLSVVSGWGTLNYGDSDLPSQLQAVDVFITSAAECNNAYAEYGGITVNMICAAVPGGGKDNCAGDQGGALFLAGNLSALRLCIVVAKWLTVECTQVLQLSRNLLLKGLECVRMLM